MKTPKPFIPLTNRKKYDYYWCVNRWVRYYKREQLTGATI